VTIVFRLYPPLPAERAAIALQQVEHVFSASRLHSRWLPWERSCCVPSSLIGLRIDEQPVQLLLPRTRFQFVAPEVCRRLIAGITETRASIELLAVNIARQPQPDFTFVRRNRSAGNTRLQKFSARNAPAESSAVDRTTVKS